MDKLEEEKTAVFTIENSKFSYSRAYELFENKLMKEKLVSKYKIKESTLEEVFLFLSQLQPPVDQVEYSEPWQFCCWERGANGCQWI